MSESLINSLVSIATAIVGVAIIAVLVSKNANTAGVLQAAGNAFGQDLGVAVSPVTGGGMGNFGNFNSLNLNSTIG